MHIDGISSFSYRSKDTWNNLYTVVVHVRNSQKFEARLINRKCGETGQYENISSCTYPENILIDRGSQGGITRHSHLLRIEKIILKEQ